MDPARLAPRHTEDHPEVLPLSFILQHQHDGWLTGDVCGHDGIYPASALAALGEQLVRDTGADRRRRWRPAAAGRRRVSSSGASGRRR